MPEAPTLTESFNDTYTAYKTCDNVLRVYYNSIYQYYDFTARVMTSTYGNSSVAVTPFSQMDPDSVIAMRDKLVELGGNPPQWPPVATARKPENKLNP